MFSKGSATMISVRAPRLFGPGLEMKKGALNKLECLCGQPEQMAEGAGTASNTDLCVPKA